MDRRKILVARWVRLAAGAAMCVAWCTRASAAEKSELPNFATATKVVDQHFSKQRDYRPGDLISQRDVQSVLNSLKSAGWTVADKDQLLKLTLPESHFLVPLLASKQGRQFARKVSSEPLIYDRLDRLAHESGGPEMLQSLVKLPDGERYALSKPARGAPSILEMLPKGKSGKARKVPDYDKPTGRIYTQDQLLKQLRKSHELAVKAARKT